MSHVIKSFSSILLLVGLAAGATACVSPDPEAPAITRGEVAALEVGHGRVTWIADDDGTVTLAEVTDLVTGPAERLVELDQATPLEVFLALAEPDAEVPEALRADHARRAGAAEPRALSAVFTGAVVSSFYDCSAATWTPWHAATTAGYSARSANFYTTSSDIGFTGYIEDQWARRFDACAGSNFYDTMNVYIDRKTNAAAVYTNLLLTNITGFQRFYYTSLGGSYADWRMRLTKPGTGFARSYGVGGAWTPTSVSGG